ncbi:MAG: hypothetical protein B0W54_13465 [Cellvibrio sp. 79]|nr:MAG: hypothetical protein B0W54_13465 [Cellvibrio sp. 79]
MRNLTLDQAKVILSIMVVMIHVGFLKDYSSSVNYFFTQSIFRIVVPIFYLVSGYFFFRLIISSGFSGFKKWFLTLLALHSFWSLVYLYFYIPFDSTNLREIFIEVVKRYIEGYWHLWFTMGLLGAGTCLYFIRNLQSAKLVMIALLLFVCGCIIQYSGNYHLFGSSYLDNITNKTHIYRNFLFFAFPFFILGYLVSRDGVVNKFGNGFLVFLFLMSFAGLCAEGALNTFYIGDYKQSFDMLFLLPFVCFSLFLVFLKSERKTSSAIYTQVSAGIYFIHPLFILLMPKFISSRIVELIIVLALSLIASFVLILLSKRYKFIL